jgi:hypothetical protein
MPAPITLGAKPVFFDFVREIERLMGEKPSLMA